VWAWGNNQAGQLGIGSFSFTPQATPVQVTSMSGAIRIVAGATHSLALKSDGTVWAWGDNTTNRLGSGLSTFSNCGSTQSFSCAPVQVVGIANAVAIATSGDASHSLALLADGTVVAWGNNANGLHFNGDASQGGDGVISGALIEHAPCSVLVVITQ